MTGDTAPELLRAALAGDSAATRELVGVLAPVVHARVARALLRNASGRKQGRDLRQDIEDFVQEVFAALLADRGRLLRGWDAEKGLSLANFVGLLAEHQVVSILRSGRRSPWKEEATDGAALDRTVGTTESPHGRVASRELLGKLLERLRRELSSQGLQIFQRLIVEERSVADVCAELGMTSDAVYAWRSRIGKLARSLHEELTRDPRVDV